MYKILIADDEMWARVSIRSKLQLLDYVFSWIGEADNGEKALDMILAEKPDIALVDIKMPFLDGIQLLSRVRELGLDTRFIIISGYAEFEYAEQAINKGVSGYLLKPVTDENIVQILQKTIQNLDTERETQNIMEEKESLEKNHQAMSMERYLNQLLHMTVEGGEAIISESLMDIMDVNQYTKHALILIHPDNTNFQNLKSKYQDIAAAKSSMKELIQIIKAEARLLILDDYKDHSQIMVLLSHTKDKALEGSLERFTVDVYTKVKKNLDLDVTIGASDIKDVISNELYRHAKAALDLRLAGGNSRIYKYDAIEIKKTYDYPEHKLKLLQNCIQLYDLKNIEIILRDIFTNIDIKGKSSAASIRFLFSEVINILLKNSSRMNLDMESFSDNDLVTGAILDHFDGPEDIVSYLYTTIINVLNPRSPESNLCKELIVKILEYIKFNYREEIVIKDLARKFAINPNYLSTIFRQETGKTIVNYITELRIERACQLLTNTNTSIMEIAQSVGYQDPLYFYRVFKKVTGLTAQEYRNRK